MNTNRAWKQVEILSIPETDSGQLAGAVDAFAAGARLLLPEGFLQQVKESLLRALAGGAPLSAGGGPVQVAIHLAGLEPPSAARWGFFLVQKWGGELGPRQLFLDLYLYQE
jgi:hypothetical protein